MFDQFCLPLGFKTGIFTNNWVDDSAGRLFTATLLGALRRHFDVVIESCRAGLHKPDPRLYAHALEVLQAKPQDVRTSTVSQGHPGTPKDTQGHPWHPKPSVAALGAGAVLLGELPEPKDVGLGRDGAPRGAPSSSFSPWFCCR